MDYFTQLENLEQQVSIYKSILKYRGLIVGIIAFLGILLNFFISNKKDEVSSQISTLKGLRQEKINQLNFRVALFEGTYSERVEFANSIINEDPILKGFNFSENINKLKTLEEPNIQRALAHYISENYKEAKNLFELILNSSKNSNELIVVNVYLGHIAFFNLQNEGKSAIAFFKQAIEVSKKININDLTILELVADAHNYMGIYYKHEGQKKDSYISYEKSLNIYLHLNEIFHDKYNSKIGGIYQNLYSLYNYSNKKSSSFNFLESAYKFKMKAFLENEEENCLTLVNTINSMVGYYMKKGDYTNVNKSYLEGKKCLTSFKYKKHNDYIFTHANLNSNYGFAFKVKADSNTSVEDVKDALKYMLVADTEYRKLLPFKNVYHKISFANNSHNLGVTSEYLRDTFFDAEQFYFEAISNREDLIKENNNYVNSKNLGDSYLAIALFYDKLSPSPKIKKEFAKKSLSMYNPYFKDYPFLEEWINKAKKIINNNFIY